jgi:hypothetical protein
MPHLNPPEHRPFAAGAIAALAAVGAAALRVFAVLPNISPVGALGLFAGGRLRWWLAWLPPVAVMAISDQILFRLKGYPRFDPWVYGSLIVYVVLGRLLTHTRSAWRIGAVSALGSLQFFLITNFGLWYESLGLAGAMYPPTPAGLLTCYAMGLPFLGYTVLGDLVFATVLFGAHAWLTRPAPAPAPAAEEVRV